MHFISYICPLLSHPSVFFSLNIFSVFLFSFSFHSICLQLGRENRRHAEAFSDERGWGDVERNILKNYARLNELINEHRFRGEVEDSLRPRVFQLNQD